MTPLPSKLLMNEDQVAQIMQAISDTRSEVSNVGLQIAKIEGTISAFGTSLEAERKAREALGTKYDHHDELLRGDGRNPGLIEQVGSIRDLANGANKEVKQIKTAIWGVGSPIALALIIDAFIRMLPVIYSTK